ncbi:hypothetical protein GQX74_015265, partial [Glossina fuscipes]
KSSLNALLCYYEYWLLLFLVFALLFLKRIWLTNRPLYVATTLQSVAVRYQHHLPSHMFINISDCSALEEQIVCDFPHYHFIRFECTPEKIPILSVNFNQDQV